MVVSSRFLSSILALTLLACASKKDEGEDEDPAPPQVPRGVGTPPADCVSNANPTWTTHFMDLSQVSSIVPRGFGGGGEESQRPGYVFLVPRRELLDARETIEIRAPADAEIESWAHYETNGKDGKVGEWMLILRVSCEVVISLNHLDGVHPAVEAIAGSAPNPDSATRPLADPIPVNAGDVVAYKNGDADAYNVNLGVYNSAVTNTFINQARYEAAFADVLWSVCPFEYFDDAMEAAYAPFFGSMAGPVEGLTCGDPSPDAPGTIRGIWYQSADATRGFDCDKSDDLYCAVGIDEDPDRVGVALTLTQDFNPNIVDRGGLAVNPSFAHVETVTTSAHCYQEYKDPQKPLAGEEQGWAYVRLGADPSQLELAYATTGACPAAFPESSKRVLYR